MPVVVTCACGKKLKARDDQAGRRFQCPGCGAVVVVPSPVVAAPILMPPAFAPVTFGSARPRAVLAPPEHDVQRAEASWWRGQLHWLLVLFRLPLLWWALAPPDDVPERICTTLAQHPDVDAHVDQTVREIAADIEEDEYAPRRSDAEYKSLLLNDQDFIVEHVIDRVPGRRLVGAFHSRSTWIHWGYALVATGVYLLVLVLVMPGLPARPLHLLWAGLFTGTAGIVFLTGIHIFGCCFVGPWLMAAESPNAPLGARLLGFLFGVGLVEEIVKMLPILWRLYRPDHIGWREACMWGMASGAGFGISEGIYYCGEFYNGIAGVDAYVIRFFSAVTLHIVLSGACAIMLQRHQHLLDEGRDFGDWLLTLTAILLVPMLLHALYNTFADEGILGGSIAILAAAASVGWLGHLINQSRRRELLPPGGGKDVENAPVVEVTSRGMRVVKRMQ